MEHSPPLPTPGDHDQAVLAEYEHFKRLGTREALELFIARYPDHILVQRARRELMEWTSEGH